MEIKLPAIPAKRYFTIGEVGELCGVKPHVLRYWEQEFTQLRPMKRRGNRRYYQHHEVLMIRRIRELLYDQGFTISGARNKLQEIAQTERDRFHQGGYQAIDVAELDSDMAGPIRVKAMHETTMPERSLDMADQEPPSLLDDVRRELLEIRELLLLRF
ncbi:MAG: MerR family transcriptional regulator [Hydrogenophaga sp.]|uniref:MerR family transcriptional regulator n=1 Tax=Hydrogenophaga sp. TaxID=1904254 RepID=UPI002ABB2C23|nr:MerR family transcriptional regulator [Hydrogenophaga sp.]MDZ4186587.1 MerR family transcriptional regulator [Hydrogenophaga sp.]